METTEIPKKIHHGRNIRRFREVFGLKQEALAIELGPDWSQKKVSRLEENEEVSDEILEQVAKVLQIPVAAIKGFTEQAAVNYFNTFNDNSLSNSNGAFSAFQCTFNALDKVMELIEENKKLYERVIALEKEKSTLLERLLNEKK